MEDGLLNKKVAFIIQARMQSTRLPGKILMNLPLENGKPLLLWIIDELKKSKFDSKIIVATSVNKENDILASFCNSIDVSCFRGDEENVLSRFITIARQNDFDCIVRLTADNPILDINILEKVIKYHFEQNNEYTFTCEMPTGMNFEVISPKCLLDIENHSISDADKEHVTMYVRNNNKYKKNSYNPSTKSELKTLRLTVDYPSDFALLALILSLSVNNGNSGLQLIEEVYSKHPWLFEINQANIQKKQFSNLTEEIKEAGTFLEQFDFKNAAKILKAQTLNLL